MTRTSSNFDVLAGTLRRSDHLFSMMQDGVILLDTSGIIIDVNPATEQMFGFLKRELVGRRPTVIQEPESETSLAQAVQEALATGRWEGAIVFRRKDGTTGMAEVVIAVPYDDDGVPVGVLSVHKDVSERYLVEATLSDTETRFQLMRDALSRSEEMLRDLQQQLGAAADAHRSSGEATPSVSSSKTILLVEDDTMVRVTIARMLRAAGYVIVEAGNGEEALTRWAERQDEIDLVMSDAVMPGLRGLDLLRQLRLERPDLPVLLVSGYLGDRLGDVGRNGEVIPILEKPFTAASLVDRLNALMM